MDEFKIIDNRDSWNFILKNFENIDCYYSFEYGDLFAKKENGKLFAAYFADNDTRLFYPFIKREIPFVVDDIFDIVTPYGYGGPLINGKHEAVTTFSELFGQYCKSHRIITETIRFHPLNGNHEFYKNIVNIEYIRKTTAVDLTSSLAEIRNQYSSMNKRNIKKAKNNNLSCFVAENNLENIRIFMDLYNETMDRNHAANYYYFDEGYFIEQVKDTDFSKTFLLFVKVKNEIIAAVMVLAGQEFSHYHLGASKTSYLDLKPNNFLFDFMIEFCKSLGSKALHLGGGYSENDGLFKFKTSFTNNNNFDFYIGKRVYDSKEYTRIIQDITKQFEVNEGYFPIYRGNIQRKKLVT